MNSYLLADDLSGALEAGAAFRAGGWEVTLAMNSSAPSSAGVLQVLSSETRNAFAPVAMAAIKELFAAQQAAGNRLLFKKIDSTLRGPVGAEVRALIDVLSPPLVVVCPANPGVGRTVRHGCLLVHGVPVTETEFRHDPGWPVSDCRVADVLAAGGVGVTTPLSLTELRSISVLSAAQTCGVLVSDAETIEDLQRLGQLVRQSVPTAIFVGSGGLAQAVARREARRPGMQWSPPAGVLIVSGSKQTRSRAQLEKLRGQHGVPILEVGCLPDDDPEIIAELVRALAERGAASLTIAKNFPASASIGPIRRLTEIVSALAAAGAEPAMLAATGGETARALCVALGIDRLDLLTEIEPGVVVTNVPFRANRRLSHVVIKPGGFGSELVWSVLVPAFSQRTSVPRKMSPNK